MYYFDLGARTTCTYVATQAVSNENEPRERTRKMHVALIAKTLTLEPKVDKFLLGH